MNPGVVIRDVLEGAIVLAMGAAVITASARLVRGQIKINRCEECERPFSRAYGHCPHCGGVRA